MVATVWLLKVYLPAVTIVAVALLAGLMGGSMLLWAVLAGAVVLALRGVLGWTLLNLLRGLTLTRCCRCVWRSAGCCASRGQRQSQLSAFRRPLCWRWLLVLRGDPRPLAAANAAGKSKTIF